MSKFTKLLAAVAVAFGFSQAAFAGFHVEPFLGYSISGNFEQSSDLGDSDGDYVSKGPQLGARIGYGMLGFFGALDYEMSPMTADDDDEVGIDQTLMGLAVGYEFPILLRAYATYVFSAEGTSDSSIDAVYKGSGLKLGVGYTGLPFVAINFEVTQLTYDSVESDSSVFDDGFDSFTANYYTVNVSVPFDF
ncbi:MAG: outer membrane beta-barrel protein [Bdellovibrionales bacterium]|nr:outer membrane beta-barrel protein [Bdellovibrionales bacterium]